MAISDTYREMLLEQFLKEHYTSGQLVSAKELEAEVNAMIEALDLSVPQFVAEDHHVERLESSSAVKFNGTIDAIRQDLRVLYKNLLALSQEAVDLAPRWKMEADAIEEKLINLEERIENLLLLTQDTEGYHSYLFDNFTNFSQIDFDNTTAEVDIGAGMVTLAPSSTDFSRLDLEELETSDIIFRVQTSIGFKGRNDQPGLSLNDIFKQQYKGWWTSVEMSQVKPVTCELTVKLADSPVEINKITLKLMDSAQSNPMSITPLYSTDNTNFAQLPSVTFTQDVRTSAVFQFPMTEMKWVKFLLTKRGPDPEVSGPQSFSYQFGFHSIAFYSDAFEADTTQTLISSPLWVADTDGNPKQFEKLTLEACEQEEEGTTIDWSVAVSSDSTFAIDSNTVWTPLSPVNRTSPKHPTIIEVGDISHVEIGDTETVTISYQGSSADANYVSPANSFHLVDADSSGVTDTQMTVSGVRYTFVNSNDRIINYQLSADMDYDPLSLQLFRNVGEKGLTNAVGNKVKGVLRGWRFEDPWYSCVIYVENAAGMSINIGDSPMVIDDVEYTGRVGESVLTGETDTTTGLHKIRVHKSNWKYVTPELETLAELKAADSLYPYNHKLLIEGYDYASIYPSSSPKIYEGADIFAESFAKKVSVFDFNNNLKTTDYDFFALDVDAPHTSGTGEPSYVFLVKVNEESSDFSNERFMIKFKLINQLRTYLRIRADLETEDTQVAPLIHSYKIKLA